MHEPSVTHSTFVLERHYPKPPQQVFQAFADPAIKRLWFGPDADGDGEKSQAQTSLEEFSLDFRPGGAEYIRYRFKEGSLFPGVVLVNSGTIFDIVQDRRLVTAHTMTLGERRISASLVTFEFLATEQGTTLTCTHQGAFFEGSDGPQMREAGWVSLLGKLATQLSHGAI
jgi:uncharacterized protein YndB with AHSA1/START domain